MAASLAVLIAGCGHGGKDLATVDGKPVTQEEFKAYLKFKHLQVSDKDAERYKPVLDQYLQRKALAIAVEDRLKNSDVLDAAQLQAELDDFRREALISRYFESYLAKAVGDDAVTNYYNAHIQEFSERRVHVAHVLLRTSRAMSEAERAAKLTKVQEAASKIRSGEDFAKVALEYSEDTISAKKGGDIGWIQEGAIDPKLSQNAFQLPVGQVSDPFETQFGFHILKVLEAPETKQRPMEAVRGDIRYRLRSEAKEAELKKLLDAVKVDRKS
jgi:peptidyl-prolyl cis-trans isomerase C